MSAKKDRIPDFFGETCKKNKSGKGEVKSEGRGRMEGKEFEPRLRVYTPLLC